MRGHDAGRMRLRNESNTNHGETSESFSPHSRCLFLMPADNLKKPFGRLSAHIVQVCSRTLARMQGSWSGLFKELGAVRFACCMQTDLIYSVSYRTPQAETLDSATLPCYASSSSPQKGIISMLPRPSRVVIAHSTASPSARGSRSPSHSLPGLVRPCHCSRPRQRRRPVPSDRPDTV